MSGSRIRPYLGPLIVLLVVLAMGAGTVYAAIPNGSGTYYACRVSNTGAVRLINYPKVKTCPAGQKLINWSQQGPAGPVGPMGPKGDPGPADWNAIANKPAGFADGVDDGAFVSSVVTTFNGGVPWGAGGTITYGIFDTYRNVDLDCYIIPTVGPAFWTGPTPRADASGASVLRQFTWQTPNGGYGEGKIRCRAYSQGIAPAALKQQLTNGKVTIKKGKTRR